MSRIRPKQIQLNSQGDLIIGGALPNVNGSILPIGLNNQTLFVNSSTLQYDWVNSLRESSTGNLVLQAQGPITSANYIRAESSSSGQPVIFSAQGSDTNINFNINAKGTGRVVISGNEYPNIPAPSFSIIASQLTPNVLNLITIPNTLDDRLVVYDTVTNTITWMTIQGVLNKIGGAFNSIALSATSTGSHTGTQPLSGTISSNLSFIATEGIGLISNNTITPQEVRFRLSLNTLSPTINLNTIDLTTDVIGYYDQSEQSHYSLTFSQLKTLIGSTTSNTVNVLTSNYTVVSGDMGTLFVINSSTPITITLPASPQSGFSIRVCNVSNTYTHIINRNGNLLNGQASNLVIDIDYEIIEIIFINGTIGWIYS